MQYTLAIVSGAPGAGKSTTVDAFRQMETDYLAFDIDWLAPAASRLAGKSIHFEPATWKPYGEIWFEVLHAIFRNGKIPVFFAPTDPADVANDGKPVWCNRVEWLLLDCDDATRLARLNARDGWIDSRIAEALEDAALARDAIARQINTGQHPPEMVAAKLIAWLDTIYQ